MPDDVAEEKTEILEKLGARVEKGGAHQKISRIELTATTELGTVRAVSIVSSQHYVNLARRRALDHGKTELVGPDPIEADGQKPYSERRQDLVVSSRADEVDVLSLGKLTGAYADRPRAFFADQFEVRCKQFG